MSVGGGILSRIGMGDVPAKSGLVAEPNRGDTSEHVSDHPMVVPHRGRFLDLGMRTESSDPQTVRREVYAAHLFEVSKADDVTGTDQPELHEQRERGATRQRHRVVAMILQKADSLVDRGRLVILEAHATRFGRVTATIDSRIPS